MKAIGVFEKIIGECACGGVLRRIARLLPAPFAYIFTVAAAISILAPLPAQSAGVTIRTKADMRLWQTVDDCSAPLVWPWVDDADSASVVFSNRLTAAVASLSVQRVDAQTHGSCGQHLLGDGRNALVDVTLVQKRGSVDVATDSAALAYVPGAGGGPLAVRAKSAWNWRRVREPMVFAFDPLWLGLAGDSGYAIAPPFDPGVKVEIR